MFVVVSLSYPVRRMRHVTWKVNNVTATKATGPTSRSAKKQRKTEGARQLYSTRINHVGALLPDTKTMLAHWNLDLDVSQNLAQMRAENVFAKTSRTRIPEMLKTFRERYLEDPEVVAALVTLEQEGAPDAVLLPILFYLAAQSDPLLHDVTTEFLASLRMRGQATVRTEDVAHWLEEQVAAGRAERAWSEVTIRRLAQGLLSTLRDFGVLQGKATKRIAPAYLPTPTFAFLAKLLSRRLRSGDWLLHAPDWQLYFLNQTGVEHLFLEAHQERLLEYHAAGRVIRVEFPAPTLKEYAHALAQRAL